MRRRTLSVFDFAAAHPGAGGVVTRFAACRSDTPRFGGEGVVGAR